MFLLRLLPPRVVALSVLLIALGVSAPVTRDVRLAVTIVDAEQLGGTMMEKLAELFDEEEQQRNAARGRRRVA